MAIKTINVCDVCNTSITENTCSMCGKELCKIHTHYLTLSIFSSNPTLDSLRRNEDNPINTLKLSINTAYDTRNKRNITICPECSTKISNVLKSLRNSSDVNLITDILALLKEKAKVEII